MTLDKLWNMIQNNENFPVIVKSKTRGYISFSAFGEENSNCTLRLYLNENGLLTIASYNPNAERHQMQRRRKETIGMSDESVFKEAKKLLLSARDAFDKDRDNKNTNENIMGKRQSRSRSSAISEKSLKQRESKDAEERFFRDALRAAMNRTEKTDFMISLGKTETPWKSNEYYGKDIYILKDDYQFVQPYFGQSGTKIRKNVLPQPYIGDPDAPIWILTMNPSYSEMDVFDLVDEQKEKMQVKKLYPNCKLNEGMLVNRQDLIRAQNSFTFGSLKNKERFDCPWFYVLDKNFQTITHSGEKALGSNEWWNKYLLQANICNPEKKSTGVNAEKLKKFFVLESFPYHSKSFDKSEDFFKNVVSKVKHYDFWRIMIKHALKGNKILLCRGDAIAKRVAEIAKENKINNAEKELIFVTRPRTSCFWISTGNFISYQAKKQFPDTIEKV